MKGTKTAINHKRHVNHWFTYRLLLNCWTLMYARLTGESLFLPVRLPDRSVGYPRSTSRFRADDRFRLAAQAHLNLSRVRQLLEPDFPRRTVCIAHRYGRPQRNRISQWNLLKQLPWPSALHKPELHGRMVQWSRTTARP